MILAETYASYASASIFIYVRENAVIRRWTTKCCTQAVIIARIPSHQPRERLQIPQTVVIRVLHGRPYRGRSWSVGYASLTHGYNLAVARLASCPDA